MTVRKWKFVENMNLTENQEMVESFNLTHVSHDSIQSKVCIISVAGLTETLGNVLLASIHLYEKFGQDPKKRTLINILISDLCLLFIAFNVFSLPIFATRMYSGPIGKKINV